MVMFAMGDLLNYCTTITYYLQGRIDRPCLYEDTDSDLVEAALKNT